ncbi:dethiobiotin synthase [Priestia sp. 40]|uniref:dethiobiotin synthase n=1 Tax=Priestia sp. 40 TaxID=3394459 RepID=UPI003BF63FDE
MGKAYFITGTGTDIGKTLVTSILYKILGRLGIKTTICKPFQTGYQEKIGGYPDIHWFETKIGVANTGIYQLKPETSPHLAIALSNRKVEPSIVLKCIDELKKEFDIVLVEGAGGLAVPLIEEETAFYMTKDLVIDAQMPVIAVGTTGLGAIHDALSTFSYASEHQLNIKGLIFNRFNHSSIIHNDNVRTIEKLLQLSSLMTVPVFTHIDEELDVYIEKMMRQKSVIQHIQEVFDCAVSQS